MFRIVLKNAPRRWLLLAAIIGLTAFAGAALAAPGRTTPAAAWPHEGSDLQPDPALIWGRLDNGFKYALMANANPRNRVSIHLIVNVGSLHESDSQQGIAHFLEHMVFNGSAHFKPGELVAYLQRMGMGFGPDANGSTSFTETVYDLLLPDAGVDSLSEGFKVIDDYARGAWLLDEQIERERNVILAEKRSRDSADYRTFEAAWRFKLPGTRIGQRLPIGRVHTIGRINRSALKLFYDAWYRPDRMMLVVVGDIDAQQTQALIAQRFDSLMARSKALPDPDPGKIDHKGVKVFYHHEKEAGQTTVSIETLRHAAFQVDSLSRQKSLLVDEAVNRMLQHRLDWLGRRSGAPVTESDVGSGIFLRWMAYAHIQVQCHGPDWHKALALIEQSLRAALVHGFLPAELDRVKKEMTAELEDEVKRAATRESPRLARQIIASLGSNEVVISPAQAKQMFGPFLADLDLTMVQAALRRLWAPDHRLVLVTGDAAIGSSRTMPPEARILAVYQHSHGQAVDPPPPGIHVDFPYLPAPVQAGRITARTTTADLGIVQLGFANGCRLNIKPTDFKADEVLINLSFGRGRSVQPADRAGLADLTEALVNESGMGPLDRTGLEAALAGTSTSLSFRVEEDRFVFAARTIRSNVPLVFQLFQACVTDPAWRADAFEVVMRRFNQQYAQMATTADGVLDLEGRRFLAAGDNRFGLPPAPDFQRLTLADASNWLGPALASAPLEVSVVGDVDAEAVEALGSLYLGGLERVAASTIAVDPRPAPGFPKGLIRQIDVPTRIDKAMVIVAFETDDVWDIGRTRRLNILAEIFSERLREVVREKLGAAYSPYAYNRPSRAYGGYGLLQAVITADPHQVPMVREQVLAIAADLAAGSISADALIRAREPSLTRIRDHLRQNAYWLNTVLTGSGDHPQQIDWARTILADYGAITAEQLAVLARRYLDPVGSAAVIILPAERQPQS
jgi:zinc protease